jgi:hypothetical protein
MNPGLYPFSWAPPPKDPVRSISSRDPARYYVRNIPRPTYRDSDFSCDNDARLYGSFFQWSDFSAVSKLQACPARPEHQVGRIVIVNTALGRHSRSFSSWTPL